MPNRPRLCDRAWFAPGAVPPGRTCGADDYLGALLQNHCRVGRQEPNKLFAVRSRQVGQRQGSGAHEIGAGGSRRAHAEIEWRDCTVGFLTDDDVAFLGAQHMHRVGAVWGYVAVQQRIPYPLRLRRAED